jgi:hypothetical protein
MEPQGSGHAVRAPGRELPPPVPGGRVGEPTDVLVREHDRDRAGRRGDGDGRGDPAERLHLVLVGVEPRPVAREAVELRDEGRQRRELADVAGEGVEEADGGVRVALQEEEALGGVEDAVVREQREVGAHEGARAAVEEADAGAEPGVARVQAMALREHRPPARVEAGVGHAAAVRVRGAGAPAGAHGAEADVVEQVSGEHALRDARPQVLGHRRPGRGGRGGGGAETLGAVPAGRGCRVHCLRRPRPPPASHPAHRRHSKIRSENPNGKTQP